MLRHLGSLLILLPALACAQATGEYGTAAAAASTASAGAKAVGNSIAGALQKLNKNLDGGSSSAKTEAPAPASRSKAKARKSAPTSKSDPATPAATPAAPAPPQPTYEDPEGIQQGMTYDDVVRRFGPPAIGLTTAPGEQSLTYVKKGASFDVKLVNGKVASVQKTGA